MGYWYNFCQGGACWYRSDDFDRPDSDNVGSNWSERTGPNWWIDNNQVRADGHATLPGKLIFQPHNGHVSFYIGVTLAEPEYQAYVESYWQPSDVDVVATEWTGLFTARHESQRLLAFFVTAVEAPVGMSGFAVDLQTCAGASLIGGAIEYDSEREDCEVVEATCSEGNLGEDTTVGVVVTLVTDSSSSSSSAGDHPGRGLLATAYWRDTTARKFGVIVNYLDDDNYFLCEYTAAAVDGENGRIELFRVAGGVKTSLAYSDEAPSWDTDLHICFTPKVFYVDFRTLPPINLWVTDPDYFPLGYKAGLYSNSPESVAFDDWTFSEHWVSNPICPRCVCYCGDNALPMTLTVTISAISVPGTGTGTNPLAACINGKSATIDYLIPHDPFWWQGDTESINGDCNCPWECFGPFALRFTLKCGTGDKAGFELAIDGTVGDVACDTLTDTLTNPDGACDPLALEFTAQYEGCYVDAETNTEDLRVTYTVTE